MDPLDHPTILTLDAVTKRFPGSDHPAVDRVSLTLQQGELLALLGPSGCGKTTLLRLIAGFEQPQAGIVQVGHRIVAGPGIWIPPEQREIGLVFQDYALFPHLTVAENVGFGLRKRGQKHSPKRTQDRIAAVIDLVGLTGFGHRYPHELSGGQQQRVALARALAPAPPLILLDEPLSNLDVQVRHRLREEVKSILKTTATSAIFVTHDQEEALAISDRVAVMQQGQIEQIDTPEGIYCRPASRFVAEFVTQANFLPAQQHQQHIWTTEVGQFEVTPQPEGSAAWGELMIRQEDLLLRAHTDGPVFIRDRQFLGRDYRYCLQAPSGLELHARSAQTLPIGSRVQVTLAHPDCRIFQPR